MRMGRRVLHSIDKVVEWTGAYMTATIVLIVAWQVYGRYVLKHTPSWTEEIALLLMMWYGFLSIASGFRYRLHLRVSMFTNGLPQRWRWWLDRLSDFLVCGFGLFLMVEGYRFTLLMFSSTLPVTKLPTAVQYVIIPITGVFVLIYGARWLLGGEERD